MSLIFREFFVPPVELARWLPCRPAQAARRLAPAASGQRVSSRPLPAPAFRHPGACKRPPGRAWRCLGLDLVL